MRAITYDAITPSESHAQAILQLEHDTLSHAIDHPSAFINPADRRQILTQVQELAAKPERFLGAFIKGALLGYMKVGDWTIDDELAYATQPEAEYLNEAKAKGEIYTAEYKLGVFGLASSIQIHHEDAETIVDTLLYNATDMALGFGHSAIQIGINEHDPATTIALEQGFVFSGRIHEPLRQDGLVKRLYTKDLDIDG